MVLTSFFDFIQAPSMRISLILHLNFAHIKPQQPNPVILVTILANDKKRNLKIVLNDTPIRIDSAQ